MKRIMTLAPPTICKYCWLHLSVYSVEIHKGLKLIGATDYCDCPDGILEINKIKIKAMLESRNIKFKKEDTPWPVNLV